MVVSLDTLNEISEVPSFDCFDCYQQNPNKFSYSAKRCTYTCTSILLIMYTMYIHTIIMYTMYIYVHTHYNNVHNLYLCIYIHTIIMYTMYSTHQKKLSRQYRLNGRNGRTTACVD